MPTSATGKAERRRAPSVALGCADRATSPASRGRKGFTLVELMVVLVIIGLLSAAVVVAVPDERPTLAKEAERFAARLVRAREEAVLTNRAVLVRVDRSGYGFQMRRRGAWTAMETPFGRSEWSAGAGAVLPDDAEALVIAFDVTGASEPAAVTLTRGAQRVQVGVDAGGEVRVDAGA